jgi:hypothetical protein
MTEPRFLLVGYGAELSLRPLAEALRARGSAVRVADLASEAPVPPEGDGPIVLVSSQHLAMTGDVYDGYVGRPSHYVSPFGLRERLGAELLVYVPHDLAEPVLSWEVPMLAGLDLYVAPDDSSWWAQAHVRTLVAGWVGFADHRPERLDGAPIGDGVLFLTATRWIMERGGAPWLLAALAQTLGSGLAVKLPVWPGMEPLREALAGHGVPLVEPELSTPDVIRATPLVVTNAPSSILAEASLAGHVPMCVMPWEGRSVFGGQLGAVDVVVCGDAEFAVERSRAGRVAPDGAGFDIDAFLGTVATLLHERAVMRR